MKYLIAVPLSLIVSIVTGLALFQIGSDPLLIGYLAGGVNQMVYWVVVSWQKEGV